SVVPREAAAPAGSGAKVSDARLNADAVAGAPEVDHLPRLRPEVELAVGRDPRGAGRIAEAVDGGDKAHAAGRTGGEFIARARVEVLVAGVGPDEGAVVDRR